MIIGKVIGSAWSTKKYPQLNGQRFLIIQPLQKQENHLSEINTVALFVAIDQIGAGVNDMVLVAQGSSARKSGAEEIPIDAAIIGIIDSIDVPDLRQEKEVD